MAISPIIVPSEDRPKKDALDRIAQVVGIASNVLGTAVAIPEYLQKSRFRDAEAKREEEMFPLKKDLIRAQTGKINDANIPLTEDEQAAVAKKYDLLPFEVPKTRGEFLGFRKSVTITPAEQRKLDQKDEEINLKKRDLEQKQKEKENAGTPLDKKIDDRFAGDYVEWETAGQKEAAETNIIRLDKALKNLKTMDNLTGKKYIVVPEDALPVVAPKAAETRSLVNGVVQLSLRPILGAAFTAEEGKRVMSNTYNINLPQNVVAQRVQELRSQLQKAFEQKKSAIEYYRKNGTLKGWAGKLAAPGDIMPDGEYGENVGDAGVF